MIAIPFKRLPIGDAECRAVHDVLAAGTLGPGRIAATLEEEFADYVGARYAVAVDSCTSALFLAFRAKEIWKHPYVRIPSMTVPLVASTVIHAGGTPLFTPDTHWVGRRYLIPEVGVYDSAHEVTRGMCAGLLDDIVTCYSFYPTKPITSFEGGMICTNSKDIADWCRKARYYGRNDTGTVSRNSWEYEIEFPGWKMNITEPQAAMALAQLRRLDELERERRRVVALYNRYLDEQNTSTYLYRIEVDDRDEFILWMREHGVECGVHFHPLHLSRAFRDCPHEDLHRCEEVGRRTVSLPLYDSLTDGEVMYIIDLVIRWWSRKGAQ